MNNSVAQFWMTVTEMNIALRVGRVASAANIADEPTRHCDDWATRVNALEVEPSVPLWLTDPWSAPDFPPERKF